MSLDEYREFHRRSVEEREEFWEGEARRIDWHRPFERVLDYSEPPFSRWFVGGELNLCHNMLDRHLEERGEQDALVYHSSETEEKHAYTYREVHREVNALAAALREIGVGKGDRVVIYLPMTPKAVFSMMACVRLGAIHSVVFGGFAAGSLAKRIDDARPKAMITADAGMRGGNVVRYKPLVDEALNSATHPPEHVVILNRNLDREMSLTEGRDLDYAQLVDRHRGASVPCEWVESSHPSYILYTSGTTGTPKGVQRDTGGYAVALAASMDHIFDTQAGETFFCASDVGWVVGHSYIVYAPLLCGMTTLVYEGLPVRPDAGVWWRLVEEHGVSTMFTSPTAIRALKKHDPRFMQEPDTSTLRKLFLAGEPLDEPTSRWASESLGVSVRDNYWQTETGWPILSSMNPGLEDEPVVAGSAGFPCAGYDLRLMHEETGRPVTEPGERGILAIQAPLPPGCMSTVWGDDERFVQTYFGDFPGGELYSTFDWATRSEDGRYFIMGRSDDVINVAGHRLGTREIEEAISSHPDVAEVAAVGVKDEYKGQEVFAYVIAKTTEEAGPELEEAVKRTVSQKLGKIARPKRVFFVEALPKTRSGKMLRRSIQALAESRDPGDLSTLEDPQALESLKATTPID
ncbi:propionate--CoA ligase [Rubrobacter radiotolerans]|uniref:Propionate--CoA ligase n=1 Tax=Rubrobacter radiotolerans TaxID=42256 RepID=A0A023X360_RUBRA|nr:propionate--CoA ligase [Rubrobacter radiotolerans]AHY46907.1 propionate--CoA ligase [Rubrobacter radiotolerans]MDX5894312.1 propionate--CoA ligase [Rubrobacter radiotolerans]SMC05702.1 propionyl-CoA synthetase [Rubrobacter radiotolerans DSM 5868]